MVQIRELYRKLVTVCMVRRLPASRLVLTMVGVLVLCMSLSSCVLSLEPIVPEVAATFDERLLGAWEIDSGSERAVVSRGDGNTYTIEYRSDGRSTRFQARLGTLGERKVFDVWPVPSTSELAHPYADVMVPGHSIFTIAIGADEVRMDALEPDVLNTLLRDGRMALVHGQSTNRLILHGTTEQLRSALGSYLARPGALSEAWRWRRAHGPFPSQPVEVPCFEASAWREADQIFHRDPHWVGADVASSVNLGGGRILWLFGDTWIDPSGTGTRQGARMVSNSVAIQRGADPTTAKITFYWGRAADGSPAALFPDRGGESLWFGNGVRVGDRLVLFFARTIRNTGTGLGFEHVGWTAVMVENPDEEPSAWQVRPLETPANPLGILVGFAAVIQQGEYVYALGSQNPVKSHPIFVARWRTEEVRRGNLRQPEWWAGERLGWIPDSSNVQRWPLFENGRSELTVHQDRATGRYLEVQTQGFGPADVVIRAAPELTGPWSAAQLLYRPPEYYRPNVMIYAAKAHPQLEGADLVLTYATNTFQFADQLADNAIYYPRFVRLTRCRAAGDSASSRPTTVLTR